MCVLTENAHGQEAKPSHENPSASSFDDRPALLDCDFYPDTAPEKGYFHGKDKKRGCID